MFFGCFKVYCLAIEILWWWVLFPLGTICDEAVFASNLEFGVDFFHELLSKFIGVHVGG
jgi:hypothetical protein